MKDENFIQHFNILNETIAYVQNSLRRKQTSAKYGSVRPIYYNTNSGYFVLYGNSFEIPKCMDTSSIYIIGTGYIWTEKRISARQDDLFSSISEDQATLSLNFISNNKDNAPNSLEKIVFDKERFIAKSVSEAIFGKEITDAEILGRNR